MAADSRAGRLIRHRYLPTAVAAGFALVYVIVSPPSLDLAAHLFRAKLFNEEGFGLWDNWWYAGHNTVGYSVPDEIRDFFADVIGSVPNADKAIFSAHCHDDLGLAVANSLAAVHGGVRPTWLQGSRVT